MATARFIMECGVENEFTKEDFTKEQMRDTVNKVLQSHAPFIELNANCSNDVSLRIDKIVMVSYSD